MIFELNEASTPQKRKERQWVELGVEFSKARKKGVTSKAFAESKEIPYATFTKAMSRYSSAIKMALKVETIKGKPVHKLTKDEKALKLINSFRTSLRDRVKDPGAAKNNKSMRWFADTMKKNIRSHSVSRPEIGKIYAFAYDAKHKDKLPYWDKFPLIIYLGDATAGNGNKLWYGLNLHYIPPKARQSFLEELLKNYANTPVISNKTKLKINWTKVKGMRGSDVMIKAYLPGHLRGPMLEIKPDDWANIVLMPTQQFVSGGKRYGSNAVWRNY